MKKKGLKRGFTLIEIGIVLMVIGIIIGAIMKGKDIIKSAEAKDFSQTFARKWVMVTDVYYDKTGRNIGGDGAYIGEINLWGSTGGTIDTTPNTDQNNTAIELANAGINLAALVKTNLYNGAGDFFVNGTNPFEVSIAGEFTDTVRVGVGFRSFYIASDKQDGLPIKRNLVIFRNVPGDVAQAFDKSIDGVANGTIGKVLAFQTTNKMDSTDDTTHVIASQAVSVGRTTVPPSPIGYGNIVDGALFTIGVILDH